MALERFIPVITSVRWMKAVCYAFFICGCIYICAFTLGVKQAHHLLLSICVPTLLTVLTNANVRIHNICSHVSLVKKVFAVTHQEISGY